MCTRETEFLCCAQVVDLGSEFPGMMKFLKSPSPLIEFIGVGESGRLAGCSSHY